MYAFNVIPPCNRETRRKVERYQKKHPELSFTAAYNKLFGTDYVEKEYTIETTTGGNDNGLSIQTKHLL